MVASEAQYILSLQIGLLSFFSQHVPVLQEVGEIQWVFPKYKHEWHSLAKTRLTNVYKIISCKQKFIMIYKIEIND